MKKKLQEIKAGLMAVTAESGEAVTTTPKSTITEEAPLLPYKEYTNKPPNLDLGEYSIKPAGDLRSMAPIAKQLDGVTKKITDLDAQFTSMRTELNERIKKVMDDSGYEVSKQEQAKLVGRGAEVMQREVADAQNAYGEAKKVLIEYNERVWALYDEASKTSVSDKEKLDMQTQALKQILSPELVKAVDALVNKGISELEKAKSEVNRKFVSWKPAKDIRKQVKEELPKSAGVVDTVTSFLSGLWESFKGLFAPIKENAADLLSLVETQIEPLLAEATVASKLVSDVKAVFTGK